MSWNVLKIGGAGLILAIAGVVLWRTFGPTPNPGADQPVRLVCPKGHVTRTNYQHIFDLQQKGQAFVDASGNGYVTKTKCPTCGEWAEVRGPTDETPAASAPAP